MFDMTTIWKRRNNCVICFVSRTNRLLLASLVLLLASPQSTGEDKQPRYVEPPVTESDREHWAFQPLTAIKIPNATIGDRHTNQIDHFVDAVLTEHGLKRQPSAAKANLIRRVYFDIVGLPPDPSAVDDFVNSKDTSAFEDLVDQLLASKGYGERWGQHWLDLARFAETDGFEHDRTRPGAWKYRDWVIQAMNDDMPYHEFLRRQIAGDELYPNDPTAITATRFCLSGPDMPDINLVEERRHTLLNEITSTVGEVVLGLQIGCAQCHDHKYDPVSQADFYRMRAIFEPSVQLQKNRSLSVLREVSFKGQSSYIMRRGDYRYPMEAIAPGVVRVVSTAENPFRPRATAGTAGLRTGLADWIVDPNNPLTSRVIVNRIWQHHFGTGLVGSPGDFGLMGEDPIHYKLLDHLASQFIASGWSLKKLHRQILTSATWRQQSLLPSVASKEESSVWNDSLTIDPDARLLSRYPRRRLEGEAIRDSMLAVSGQLNRQSGGPGVRPPLPKELVKTLLKKQWDVTADESQHVRRSIYVFARRNLRYPIFEVFDRPSANASCSSRSVSTTAPQSLHLLNSDFSLQTARKLAAMIEGQCVQPHMQVQTAFRRTLSRSPTDTEIAQGIRLVECNSTPGGSGLVHLCLALLNCNEFIFID